MTSNTKPTGSKPPSHTEDISPPTYTENDPQVATGIDQTTGSNDQVTGSSPEVTDVNHAANILLNLAEHDITQPSPTSVPVPPYPRPFVPHPHPNPGSPSDSGAPQGDLTNDPRGRSSTAHQDTTTREVGGTTADSPSHTLVEKTKTAVVEIDPDNESVSDSTTASDSSGAAPEIDPYLVVTAAELGLDGDNLDDTTQAALQELNRVGGVVAAELQQQQHPGSERHNKEIAQRGPANGTSHSLYAGI